MRIRTLAIAAAVFAASPAAGFAPIKGAENPVVTPSREPRAHRDVAWRAPAGRLAALPAADRWRVIWDRDTDVPARLWGPAMAAPGTSSDPAAAESFARIVLAQQLSLLAPGAALADFTVLANVVDAAGLRTVSFAQTWRGLRVVGGAVAFTFSHDKLTMISSSALPNIDARVPATTLAPSTIASAARSWLAADGHKITVKAHGSRVLLPVIHARGTRKAPDIEYRVAETVEAVASEGAGSWRIWLDASDASPVARATTTYFASGTVLYDTPDRHPGGVRSAKPAASASHTVNGMPQTSGLDGTVSWETSTNATVAPGLTGPLVRLTNSAGALAAAELSLAPDGSVTWSHATSELSDAQLTAFIAAGAAKEFARAKLNPSLAWLDTPLPVVVNEDDTCNAFSTGNAIHFFKGSFSDNGLSCENTGRLTDVVYHEFGHSLHDHSVIPGEGMWEGALSEGLADTLAQAITGDPGMGRGFFRNDDALRHLDPQGYEKRWPDDVTGEVHDDGEIIGGTLWDLRVALEAQLGVEAGYAQFLKIFYGIMQRASDIPTSYAAALVTDDNDGDLSNGTPNFCTIDSVFAAHGLADPSVSMGLEPPQRTGFKIAVTSTPREVDLGCAAPTIESGTLTWKTEGGTATTVDFGAGASPHEWSANIATQPDGTVVRYAVELTLSNGATIKYPQNPGDPLYQFYVGNVETLWCADFENGLGDWTVGASNATRIEWAVGTPAGIGGDPKSAYAGDNVLGIDFGTNGTDGLYRNRLEQWAESPAIDVQGRTNVRLQYYRWLGVEDGIFDKATIRANDQIVWSNYKSASQNTDGIHHTDKEWRFHDVDVSAQAATGTVKLKFALESDEGLAFAGWNIDEVCLVTAGPPAGTCGNFNVDEGETCDDGNTDDGDACPADCGLPPADSGCCSVGTNPAGPLALSLLTLGLVVRRRRRR